MQDCLAILGRGDFSETIASQKGAENDCPFCIGRKDNSPRLGDTITILNGYRAGTSGVVSSERNQMYGDGFLIAEDTDSETLIRVRDDLDLYVQKDLAVAAEWMAPFKIEILFIIDELSVWFCNRNLRSNNFLNDDFGIIEIIRVCWEKRIAITPSEMSSVLNAHGMPQKYSSSFEEKFSFGMDCLVAARNRKPVRKWRLKQ